MRTGLYESQLNDIRAELLTPDVQHQRQVMAALARIKAGETDSTAQRELCQAATHLISRGADVLIAGCTEVLLGLDVDALPVPVIDPAQELALKIVGVLYPQN